MSEAWGAAEPAEEVRVRGGAVVLRAALFRRDPARSLTCAACLLLQAEDMHADADWGGEADGETQNDGVPARRRLELQGDAAIREAKARPAPSVCQWRLCATRHRAPRHHAGARHASARDAVLAAPARTALPAPCDAVWRCRLARGSPLNAPLPAARSLTPLSSCSRAPCGLRWSRGPTRR
jgi:hypothetical protein